MWHLQGCGWIHDSSSGLCTEGDFEGPLHPLVKELGASNRTWTYGECPDVNECELDHYCHPNSTCINTPGSYFCQCKKGFKGDGKSSCEQTCYEDCLHGKCSSTKNFTCECDLGWTGDACTIDCGCNFHSSCQLEGPGKNVTNVKTIHACDKTRHCESDWPNGSWIIISRMILRTNTTSPQLKNKLEMRKKAKVI